MESALAGTLHAVLPYAEIAGDVFAAGVRRPGVGQAVV